MNARALTPDLLSALVAVVDQQSFTRAAEATSSTQSTVSQKIARLEQALGGRLLERSAAGVALTEVGERFIGYARRILALTAEAAEAVGSAAATVVVRLGVPEDFAAGKLTGLLAQVVERRPTSLLLEITSGLSNDLRRLYDHGELDLILVKQRRNSAPHVFARPEPLAWIDSRARPVFGRRPVPIVGFPQGGLYRSEMIAALEANGIAWRAAFSSSSLAGVQAAVTDGLGISLLPALTVLPGHRVLGSGADLPEVPPMEIVIDHRADAPEVVRELATDLHGLILSDA